MTLTWIPPAEDGGSEVTKYHVFSKNNDSIWKDIGCVPSSQTNYETGELTAGSYLFAVSAENSEGCGAQVETSDPTVVENAAGMFFCNPRSGLDRLAPVLKTIFHQCVISYTCS